jgi:glucose-6-phosphate 1-dehydrogenase
MPWCSSGATGDLAYKQVFPALAALVSRGALSVPVIGVAKAGWQRDQLAKRVQASLRHHGGIGSKALEKLTGLLRYVDGDYRDPATFDRRRQELGEAKAPPELAPDSSTNELIRRYRTKRGRAN